MNSNISNRTHFAGLKNAYFRINYKAEYVQDTPRSLVFYRQTKSPGLENERLHWQKYHHDSVFQQNFFSVFASSQLIQEFLWKKTYNTVGVKLSTFKESFRATEWISIIRIFTFFNIYFVCCAFLFFKTPLLGETPLTIVVGNSYRFKVPKKLNFLFRYNF